MTIKHQTEDIKLLKLQIAQFEEAFNKTNEYSERFVQIQKDFEELKIQNETLVQENERLKNDRDILQRDLSNIKVISIFHIPTL